MKPERFSFPEIMGIRRRRDDGLSNPSNERTTIAFYAFRLGILFCCLDT